MGKMKNTKKYNIKKNKTFKKNIKKGKGGGLLWSSSKKEKEPAQDIDDKPDIIVNKIGDVCQAKLFNPQRNYDRPPIARHSQLCNTGLECLTQKKKLVSTKDQYARRSDWEPGTTAYKGNCDLKENMKQSTLSKIGSKIGNAGFAAARVAGRTTDVGGLAAVFPKNRKEFNRFYSKNIWRNLKRNMVILASMDTKQFEDQFNKQYSEKDQQDFKNLLDAIPNYTYPNGKPLVELEPVPYDTTISEDTSQSQPYSIPQGQDSGVPPPPPPPPQTSTWKTAQDKEGRTYWYDPTGKLGQPTYTDPTQGGRKINRKKNRSSRNRKLKKQKSRKN